MTRIDNQFRSLVAVRAELVYRVDGTVSVRLSQPSTAYIRRQLEAAGFRWHAYELCWIGQASRLPGWIEPVTPVTKGRQTI